MPTTTRLQRRYDRRLRELVRSTGDITLAAEHGVPASTARGWLTLPQTDVVTLDVFDLNAVQLQQEVIRLRRKITQLTSLLRLALVVLRVSNF